MLSIESQVLTRHLSQLQEKTQLYFGYLQDDFPFQFCAQKTQVVSAYFNYVQRYAQQPNLRFSAEIVIDEPVDLLVYYWSKNKQEVIFQLMQVLSQATIGQQMLIIGENRSGVRSVEKILQPFGHLHKIDSARRCGLYHFELTQVPAFNLSDYWQSYQHPLLASLNIQALPGTFSAHQLDLGTALLLETLKTHPIHGDVLDLGCGAGIIGTYIKSLNSTTNVVMSDIHAMALLSAEKTLIENGLAASVIASDVFSHIDQKFDVIISNPPFHEGRDTDYQAVQQLIQRAMWHLKEGGELRVVANSFLPYADWLDKMFGQHTVLTKNTKFKVYSVRV